MIRHSATLAVNELVRAKQARGERVTHLAFGEAGLPVLPEIAQVLAESTDRNSYGPVAGSAAARQAAANHLTRRGLETTADQIVFGPGSKSMLFAVLAALPGDVILPRPSWVSYAAQAALVGKRVSTIDIPGHAGGVPDPDLLDRHLATAGPGGVLIVTLPDNPTGTLASPQLVKEVCEVANIHDLVIVSDEIYRDLSHTDPVHSPALELPERTVVTSGLSKSTALGGYRIGYVRVPHGPLFTELHAEIIGVASEVWSALPGPMQAVAEYVLNDPPEIRAYIDAARNLHRTLVTAVYNENIAAGASCRAPQGGFYLYPDFSHARSTLGIHTGEGLARHLLDRHGVAVLAGEAFGDDGLRFRVATSLLCGVDTEQRWTAMHSSDPLRLPWIADSLEHIRTAFRSLMG
ncbi:pyridoxal phosphate-dependent aminotransferase [Actinocrispum wychmicini]|uniref:Aminotransferase n=1 Tax=Actinocrispum wychmicini TaxID=1213861 RepID=A0A4R2JF06_9PSEU|nr:pyridoxal phosphate-dependent aminotransferase [Actinocrispum wychmicini]TCO54839.1 aspartate aminotransferase [Actinocrispum wychmicini]